MPRKKKPKNETKQQAKTRRHLEKISNASTRSEKTAWNRKMNNMVKLMAKLRPIEDEIMQLQAQKEAIFDDIQILRNIMVDECIHPYEYLLKLEDHTVCKFCNKKIGAIDGKKGKEKDL